MTKLSQEEVIAIGKQLQVFTERWGEKINQDLKANRNGAVYIVVVVDGDTGVTATASNLTPNSLQRVMATLGALEGPDAMEIMSHATKKGEDA